MFPRNPFPIRFTLGSAKESHSWEIRREKKGAIIFLQHWWTDVCPNKCSKAVSRQILEYHPLRVGVPQKLGRFIATFQQKHHRLSSQVAVFLFLVLLILPATLYVSTYKSGKCAVAAVFLTES